MENDPNLEAMVEQLGGQMPEPEPQPEPDPEPAPESQDDPAPQEEHQEPEQHEPEPEPDAGQKAQQAFIHMRQQNKQQADILRNVASMLGIENIDPNNDQQIITALQDRITANQAEQQHVPVELLQRLNTLERNEQAHIAAQRQQDAALGLQRVADKFKLDQKQLNQFANDLLKNGINPLETQCNLVREYTIMHHDDLVQAAVDDAIAKEQARAAKAASASSTPDKHTSGAPSGEQSKVNSVRELGAWMSSQLN